MSFSTRMGLVPEKQIQVTSMDIELRTSIWNILSSAVLNNYLFYTNSSNFFYNMWQDYFKWDIDNFSEFPVAEIKNWFFKTNWFEVYDFVEYIIGKPEYIKIHHDIISDKPDVSQFNKVLEREMSGYRIVNSIVTPIINETELKAVEDALAVTGSEAGFEGAHEHLNTALAYLSNRKSPDYRNSIKESISAVEAVAGIIINNPKADFSKAVKKIKHDFNLHPSFAEALTKLYGYTSDGDGIRHALVEDSNAGFAEAKFMLVTCSAFTNYVIQKIGKTDMEF